MEELRQGSHWLNEDEYGTTSTNFLPQVWVKHPILNEICFESLKQNFSWFFGLLTMVQYERIP